MIVNARQVFRPAIGRGPPIVGLRIFGKCMLADEIEPALAIAARLRKPIQLRVRFAEHRAGATTPPSNRSGLARALSF